MSGTASTPEASVTPTFGGAATAPRGPADATVPDDAVWRDPRQPVSERVADLLKRMTLEEKLAQLGSAWVGASVSTDDLAPHQHEMVDETVDWADQIRHGLGQLTRPYGTAPIAPVMGARALAHMQAEIAAKSRFAIPAMVHEECLTGFMTWGATVFPTPLAWGATFDPALIEAMAVRVGSGMRLLGVHQGLAPVLDVTRDPRWGRTEETIGEDPYLVATLGTAYVRGLEAAGIIATLKHFVGYSASRAGRNFAPAAVGRRELADVLLPPFEMALREGGARSVMHSYAEIDGVPPAADESLLTGLLRGGWSFEGIVVSDYFGVSFLENLHHVSAGPSDAAAMALAAGVDVELPATRCYGAALLSAVRDGVVPESLVDRAAGRVLRQKVELGLLDPRWSPTPPALDGHDGAAADGAPPAGGALDGAAPDGAALDRAALDGAALAGVDLDPPESRALARRIAEESIVLLSNDGVLPLGEQASIALVGPQADDSAAMLGCYTFPSHVGSQHPQAPPGVAIPTLFRALRTELAQVEYVPGCDVDGTDTAGIPAAVAAARAAGVCVVALGDRAGLFGQGTSGEGSDATDLSLPGCQEQLLEALVDTGVPVVLVLLSGRPYALGRYVDRLAAIVQAFFPGEEGGAAVAGVLAGRASPSGRLPVSVPRAAGGQPATYLTPPLGLRTEVSSADPTPLFGFGHGLSYTDFEWSDPRVDGRPIEAGAAPVETTTDGQIRLSVRVRNAGGRAGAEVVQLYLHDPVAQVTRPVIRLIGYAKVRLEPGSASRVTFEVPADLSSFTGRDGSRIVEPGELELRLSTSSTEVRYSACVRLVGPERCVDHTRRLSTGVLIEAE